MSSKRHSVEYVDALSKVVVRACFKQDAFSFWSQAFALPKSSSGARRPKVLSAVEAAVEAYLEGAVKDQLQASLKAKQQVKRVFPFMLVVLCQGLKLLETSSCEAYTKSRQPTATHRSLYKPGLRSQGNSV